MKRRDFTIHRGRFTRLKLHAFGVDQILGGTFDIEIHQLTANPARWAATPILVGKGHKWEAATVDDVKAMVAADFEEQVLPWKAFESQVFPPRLQPAADGEAVYRPPRQWLRARRRRG